MTEDEFDQKILDALTWEPGFITGISMRVLGDRYRLESNMHILHSLCVLVADGKVVVVRDEYSRQPMFARNPEWDIASFDDRESVEVNDDY